MGLKTLKSKSGILLILFVLSISLGSAQSIDIKNGAEIWAHSGHDTEISGDIQCPKNTNNRNMEIESPEGTLYTQVDVNQGSFSYNFDHQDISKDPGEYTLKLDCGDDGIDETQKFNVKHFSLKRVSPNEEVTVYKDNTFSIRLAGYVNGNQVQLDSDSANFNANLLDGGSFSTYQGGINNKGTQIDFEVPENTNPGGKSLLTSVEYKKDNGVKANAAEGPLKIEVNPTWGIQVLNTTPDDRKLPYQNLAKMRMTAKATKKGENYNTLGSDDFFLKVKRYESENKTKIGNFRNKDMLSSAWKGKGKYDLGLSKIPDLPLGRYDFAIGLEENNKIITNFTVSKYILFEGSITDASGKPVNGRISFDKKGFQKEVNVEGGEYSGNVLPGSYNFSLDFPQAKLSLDGVKLQESKNTVREGEAVGNIRYDEIPIGEVSKELDGIEVANAVAVWFGYSFEEGQMSLNYDTSKVTPSDLKVYECVGWNMEGVNCYESSKWREVNVSRSNIHPTVGEVNFPVTAYNETGSPMLLNAYMVVKNSPLQLEDVSLGSDRVMKGGDLTVDGSIKTPSGDSVGGASVDIKIVDLDGEQVSSSQQVVANTHGAFSESITVPDEEGRYMVRIEADKKPYESYEKTLDPEFEVYTEKSISVEAPSTEKFPVGSTSESEYDIVNTGQSPIEDVKLSLKGFNSRYWNFQRDTWSELPAGKKVSTTLVTNLPEEFCEEACQEYRTIDIEVTGNSGGKINDMDSLQAQIVKDRNETRKSVTQKDNSGDLLSAPSIDGPNIGKFVEKQSNFNMALGLLLMFVVVLVAAVKKNKNNNGRKGRNRVGSYGDSGGSLGRSSRPKLNSVNDEEVIDIEPSESRTSSNTDSQKDSQTESNNSVKGLKCGTCGEKFDTETALEIHEESVH